MTVLNNAKKKLTGGLILAAPLLLAFQPTANAADSVEQRLANIESQLNIQNGGEPSRHEVTLYGSIRPTITRTVNNGTTPSVAIGGALGKEVAVGDALSRIGIKGRITISNQLTAIFQGDWRVEIAKNGQFGRSRLAFVGLESKDYGTLSAGKQFPPQYTLIAEPVDIFNHASSPFAYNEKGTFYLDNSLMYQLNIGSVTLMAAGQFRGSNSASNNNTDYWNTGLGYHGNGSSLAVAYNWEINAAGDRTSRIGLSASHTFFDTLYTAAAYQNTRIQPVAGTATQKGGTLDATLSYAFSTQSKLKSGFIWYDDGKNGTASFQYTGYNLTLEHSPVPNFRLHLEYLAQNFRNQGNASSITAGMRYDFSQTW